VPFSVTLNDPNQDFKSRHSLSLNISETAKDAATFVVNGFQIMLFRMTLSDLAKYSMTQYITGSLKFLVLISVFSLSSFYLLFKWTPSAIILLHCLLTHNPLMRCLCSVDPWWVRIDLVAGKKALRFHWIMPTEKPPFTFRPIDFLWWCVRG